MLKVLIVDDEYYFRQALKVSLPWETLGFRLAGEAKNGKDALALLAEIEPDVVLVDINMPLMDGMELIRNARLGESAAKFIVLTGHSEFAYAKQAVQLGVFNYVLKPIDENELRSSLLGLKALIQKERTASLELESLKRQAEESMPVLKERLLNEWLQGSWDRAPASVADRLRDAGIELSAPVYRVVVIAFDETGPTDAEEGSPNRRHAIRDIAEGTMPSRDSLAGCFDAQDRFVLIVGNSEDSNVSVEPILAGLLRTVRTTLGTTVTIGVGNSYPGLANLSVSYKEAVFALRHRFVRGGDQVIPYSAVAESGLKGSLFSVEKRSRLLMCLRIGNLSETEVWLADFFQNARHGSATMEMLLVAGLEIVSTCLEFLGETSLGLEQVFPHTPRPDLMQRIQEMSSFAELENWIRSLIFKVMEQVHGNKKSRALKVVEEVKLYIQTHYGNEELRIEDIAKCVHMNYNHLCYVFKKMTSTTINDYLTEVRISKAKELFDRGEKVVQSIASRVGYADANYFGKCFKRYIGITPGKYVKNVN